MSVYSDVLDAVVRLAENTEPYCSIDVGSMPPDNGISLAWASSSATTFLSKRAAVEMTAVLNGKHSNQKTVANALGKIHTSLSMRKEYPNADNYQITDISTVSAPSYLGREENNQWLYGSSLRVKFYLKGD